MQLLIQGWEKLHLFYRTVKGIGVLSSFASAPSYFCQGIYTLNSCLQRQLLGKTFPGVWWREEKLYLLDFCLLHSCQRHRSYKAAGQLCWLTKKPLSHHTAKYERNWGVKDTSYFFFQRNHSCIVWYFHLTAYSWVTKSQIQRVGWQYSFLCPRPSLASFPCSHCFKTKVLHHFFMFYPQADPHHTFKEDNSPALPWNPQRC